MIPGKASSFPSLKYFSIRAFSSLFPTSSTARSFLLVDSIGEEDSGGGGGGGLSPVESDSEENNLGKKGAAIGARKGALEEG